MQILIFSELALKMPINAPKMVYGFDHLNGSSIYAIPKCTFISRVVRRCHRNQSTTAGSARDPKNKVIKV